MKYRNSIESLLHTYAERVDRGDFDALSRLFTHGGIHDPAGKVIAWGSDEVRELYRDMIQIHPETRSPQTQHLVSNLKLEIDEKRQRVLARSCYTVLQQRPGQIIEIIMSGKYFDVFVKVNDDWRFSEHHMRPCLFGDLSRHLKVDAAKIKQWHNAYINR